MKSVWDKVWREVIYKKVHDPKLFSKFYAGSDEWIQNQIQRNVLQEILKKIRDGRW